MSAWRVERVRRMWVQLLARDLVSERSIDRLYQPLEELDEGEEGVDGEDG